MDVLSKENLDVMIRIPIGEDNMRCIRYTRSPLVSDLSKPVDLKYKFFMDHITKHEIDINYGSTNQMIEDLFTKHLKKIKIEEMIELITPL